MADGGFDFTLSALAEAVRPPKPLWVDEWAEQYMFLPKGNAAEHGKYRVERTPLAKEIMRCLSPEHPCRRVVVRGPSQMLKTQVGLNWIAALIDAQPDNMMVLMPTLPLARRLSSRISKTIAAVPKLRGAVADVKSRDARNTIDTKELTNGGTLFITTAGSAANLAEVPARYGYGDEVDRWDGDVGGEGDPIKIFEARFTTHSGQEKIYYSSSPKDEGSSRISTLYDGGTQRNAYVPCPHCGEHFVIVDELLQVNEALTHAWVACPNNGCIIEESSKPQMFAAMLLPENWRSHNPDATGETESFQFGAHYAPLGWISWLALARERAEAEEAEARGDRGPIQVYRNTRCGLPYAAGKLDVTIEQLVERSLLEKYREMTVPAGGLVLTCGVDVQGDRLAVVIRAWGRERESWLVYWGEISGITAVPNHGAWLELEPLIFGGFQHESGAVLTIRQTHVDTSDGNATQDAAYDFCRRHRGRGVVAVKGASEVQAMRREIYTPPQRALELDPKLKASKYGLRPHIVGTHKAKDQILEVMLGQKEPGPLYMHVYADVRGDYFEQLTVERKVTGRGKRSKGRKVWECPDGKRNEALDCEVYALHAAYALKLHMWKEDHWVSVENGMRQRSLLPAEAPVRLAQAPVQSGSQPAPEVDDAAPAVDAVPAVSQEKPVQKVEQERPSRAADREWLQHHDNWLSN